MLASFRNKLSIGWSQFLLDVKKSFQGNAFVLDHDWGKLWYSGDGDQQEILYHLKGSKWYQNEYSKLSNLIHPGSTVIDVGANMGFMALIFSRLVGDTGRVVSLEPSKKTFKKLRRNIQENGLKNIICQNLGCASSSMDAELYKVSGSSGHSSLKSMHGDTATSNSEIVTVDTLDRIVEPYKKIDFLKIDTEGFESEVLLGAQKTLEKKRPIIYIELSAQYNKSSEKSIEILRSADYKFLTEPTFSGNHSGDNFIVVPKENLA